MLSLCLFINLFTEVYEIFCCCFVGFVFFFAYRSKHVLVLDKVSVERNCWQTGFLDKLEFQFSLKGEVEHVHCLVREWILVWTFERACVYNKYILFFPIISVVRCSATCFLSGWWLMPGLKAFLAQRFEAFCSANHWSRGHWSRGLETLYLVNKKYSLSFLNCLLHMEVASVVIHVCSASPEKSGPLNAISCKYSNTGSFRLFSIH